MLVYPKFTALDLIGPHTIFAQLSSTEVHLVGKTLDAVTSDARRRDRRRQLSLRAMAQGAAARCHLRPIVAVHA